MATPNYEVNYDDERFADVAEGKQEALNNNAAAYDGMINESDKFYQDQINASKEWADKQSALQQEQTDFTIEQIEQQKGQARNDYLKEQSGAYVDWQKQSNQYGANAEKMASAGLAGTGFSESSQVSMYNTYQNRVSSARESYNMAVLNYNNAIKDARLQNNSVLAEIAAKALQQQLELSLQGFQYKNSLILEKANKELEIDNIYYSRWQDVLNQINTENAMAEEIRQFNETQAMEQKKLEEDIRQYNKDYDLKVKQLDENIRQFNEEIKRLKAKDAQEYDLAIKELEHKKQQLQLQKDQLAEEKRQFNNLHPPTSVSGGGGGTQSSLITRSRSSSSSGSSKGGTKASTVKKTTTTKKTSSSLEKSAGLLGYGPLSAQGLAKKVATGEVAITKNKNGQTVAVKNPNYNPLNKYKLF